MKHKICELPSVGNRLQASADVSDASGAVVASIADKSACVASEVVEPGATDALGYTAECHYCLPMGDYVLNLHDTFGDGWKYGVYELTIAGCDELTGTLPAGDCEGSGCATLTSHHSFLARSGARRQLNSYARRRRFFFYN